LSAPSEPRPIGPRLRALREAAGVSQSALASRTGIRQGRISELELAARVPTTDLVTRCLDALAVPADVRQDVLDQLIEHRAEVALWRRLHRAGLRQHQQRYADMERSATTIREWADHVVPGLLQTAAYTRAMCRAFATLAVTDIESIVSGRAERQQVLRDRGKRFVLLLGEAALRTHDIPAEVMDEQLDSILLTSAASHVDVGVVPLGAIVAAGAFLALDDQAVMVQLETRELTIREPDEVTRYLDVFERLHTRALRGEALADLIRDVRHGLARTPEQLT
jgi:transcriptional regulator with XRE-family HTH domain